MESLADKIPTFLTTQQVADIIGRSRRTLEKDRLEGSGPPFHKFGRRVLYKLEDVLAWAESCRRTSTSDPGPDREV